MPAIRGVLFDLGNTLLEFDNIHRPEIEERSCGAVCGVLAARDWVPRDRLDEVQAKLVEALRRFERESETTHVEHAAQDLIARALGEIGLPPLEDPLLARLAEAHYAPIAAQVTPYEDTRDTLARLRERGLRLGIVSNTIWPPALHERDLERHDLREFIEIAIYSSVHGWAKPHPSIFLEALRELSLDPAETLFVGDRPDKDVRGARDVGMIPILKAHPINEGIRGQGEAAVIDRLSDLLPLLDARCW